VTDEASLISNLGSPFPRDRASILSLIRAGVAERGNASVELRVELPAAEEEENQGPERIRFVAGALDALVGGPDSSTKQTKARTLVAAMTKMLRQPSTGAFEALWRVLRDGKTNSIVDETLNRLASEAAQRREALAALSRRLINEAPDVETVKMGVAILGISGAPDDASLILEIGQSDEFTLYSAVALANLLPDCEAELWRLAKSVHGWGRIAAVERLANTRNEQIKAWMLRDGFRNSIMYEYLAYIAATAGQMLQTLSAPEIDDELLLASAEILSALIMGGPAEQIENYRDGPAACVAFLGHALTRESPPLSIVSAVADIKRLGEGERIEGLKALPGWSPQVFLDIRTCTAAFLQKPGVRAAIEAGLRSDEPWGPHFVAARLAPAFGIDPWPFHLDRQRRRIGDNWWHLMQTEDANRVDEVIALARGQLDLALVGSGPSSALGLGPGFRDDSAVDFIVQDLRRFPGHGADFIEVGLNGRSIRLRHMAINALRDWGREHWPEGMDSAVKAALLREPEQDVRDRMKLLLAGKLAD
jgi:hypothetical protein